MHDHIHLTAGGVSVLLEARDRQLPSIVHWGAALGRLNLEDAVAVTTAARPPRGRNTVDETVRVSVLPEGRTGWPGRPGLQGSRDGRAWSPRLQIQRVMIEGDVLTEDGTFATVEGGGRTTIDAIDDVADLALTIDIELTSAGVLRMRATLTNHGEKYRLDELTPTFPIPPRAREILDFAGRWGRERAPQRAALNVGTHMRESRRGRTGADSAYLLTVGEPGFGFARGEVWGVHVGFSGNHRHCAERVSSGEQVIAGGELLLPGEIVLDNGENYRTPWVYGVYGRGLDDQANRLHRHLRSRPGHPARARPVTLNVWEAVYFDHDLARLTTLADHAASVGVERFVLDDGWFRHRRSARAGLGDWYVDEEVWPDGLGPLVDHVGSLGMEFGLWFEPEMVNPDSDLARAHPEWIMKTGGRMPVESRHQQVLNLGVPDAYRYVLDCMTDILDSYDIAYVKWDHNRDLVDAGTFPGGEPGVHAQTLAAYRLMDAVKRRFPRLEIESCSSGGARIDLGVLERTDRVWVSDCIDPLERQMMNRWTQQLIPLELMGSHIASRRSHTTGREHDLAFRAGTALFGHLGVEWDLEAATPEEVVALTAWIRLYKRLRPLLHSGVVVRLDDIDPSVWINGVVSIDRSHAVFAVAFVGMPDAAPVGRVTLRGLDPDRHYRVMPLGESIPDGAPPWFGSTGDGVVMAGRALEVAGLQMPMSTPERVWLIELHACSR